mmetsp:Transcript_16209/g.50293  ORF Transcript_16209/g.50293 Transcript_16209/m.50293 type:complete len:317 (+) Transcript_16209:362-1312(+)
MAHSAKRQWEELTRSFEALNVAGRRVRSETTSNACRLRRCRAGHIVVVVDDHRLRDAPPEQGRLGHEHVLRRPLVHRVAIAVVPGRRDERPHPPAMHRHGEFGERRRGSGGCRAVGCKFVAGVRGVSGHSGCDDGSARRAAGRHDDSAAVVPELAPVKTPPRRGVERLPRAHVFVHAGAAVGVVWCTEWVVGRQVLDTADRPRRVGAPNVVHVVGASPRLLRPAAHDGAAGDHGRPRRVGAVVRLIHPDHSIRYRGEWVHEAREVARGGEGRSTSRFLTPRVFAFLAFGFPPRDPVGVGGVCASHPRSNKESAGRD